MRCDGTNRVWLRVRKRGQSDALQSLSSRSGRGRIHACGDYTLCGFHGGICKAPRRIRKPRDQAPRRFTVAHGFTRVTRRVIDRSAGRIDAATDHRKDAFYHVVQVGVYPVAGLANPAIWRGNVDNLLIAGGAFGIVLGFAAREVLGSVLSSFVSLFARPFEVGDWVVIDDREGVVIDVSAFNTQLRTLDDEYVMIPNDRVTGEKVLNRSRRGRLRTTAEVDVDYDVDVEHAAQVASAALRDVTVSLDEPRPRAVLKRFGKSSVVLELRCWIDDPTVERMWRTRTAAVESIETAFDREGIDVPYPRRTFSVRDGPRVEERATEGVDTPVWGGGGTTSRDVDANGRSETRDVRPVVPGVATVDRSGGDRRENDVTTERTDPTDPDRDRDEDTAENADSGRPSSVDCDPVTGGRADTDDDEDDGATS
jgi:small-conductance mechanosensitive channel